MDREIRQYLRDFTPKEKNSLKRKYFDDIIRKRPGFISSNQRKFLLRIKNKPQSTTTSDFFYTLRENAKSTLNDLNLLTEVLTEDQLQEIFGTEEGRTESEFSKFLTSLLPSKNVGKQTKKKKLKGDDQRWKKDILNDAVIKGLEWYLHSGLIKTQTEQRTIKESADVISVASKGVNTHLQEPKTVLF